MNLNQLTQLLLEFQKIPKPKRAKTFLEISGYPHYENVCSNILKFFLEPHNEHGLKDLVLNALVQLVDQEFQIDYEFEMVKVHRELRTLEKTRLDLLIETKHYVIGIENKIFHFLNNDLNDYSNTVQFYCKNNKKKPINIILSLNKLSNEQDIEKANASNFINITYNELFTNIKNNLGNYLTHSNPTYSIYLTDFISSIQNLKPETMEDKALWKFFSSNSELVQELLAKYSEFKINLYAKAEKLMAFLPRVQTAPSVFSQWIWDGRTEGEDCFALVHDYKIGAFEISINAIIEVKGWTIELFGRNDVSKEFLFSEMCSGTKILQKPLAQYETRSGVIIQQFETEVDLEEVAKSLMDLLKRIEDYKKEFETIGR